MARPLLDRYPNLRTFLDSAGRVDQRAAVDFMADLNRELRLIYDQLRANVVDLRAGDDVFVNTVDATDPDFNNTTPAPPGQPGNFTVSETGINVKFQRDTTSPHNNVSSYIPRRPDLLYSHGMPVGKLLNTTVAATTNIYGSGLATAISGDTFAVPVRGYLRNLTVNTSTAQAQGNTSIVRVFVDQGLSRELAVSIPPGSAQGIFRDALNAILLQQGEGARLDLKVSGAGGATNVGFITAEFVPLTDKAIFGLARDNATVAGGDTLFCVPGTDLASAGGLNEDRVEIKVPFACTIKNLFVRTGTTQTANGSLVFTLRKNQAAAALTTTVPAGNNQGIYSDITNSVAFVAGDTMCFSIVNNAPATVSAQILSVLFEIVPTGTVSRTILSGGAGGAGNITDLTAVAGTLYWPPFTDEQPLASEVLARFPCPRAGVVRNFYVKMRTFDVDNVTTFRVYKNGVAAAVLVTVSGVNGAMTWYSDTTNSVSVAAGDYIYVREDVTGVGADTQSQTWSMEFAES